MTASPLADLLGAAKLVAVLTIESVDHALPLARALVAGGVAANQTLRATLTQVAAENGLAFAAPPGRLCTDNAAMIAWAGVERFRLGLIDGLDFAPRPRWPLAG